MILNFRIIYAERYTVIFSHLSHLYLPKHRTAFTTTNHMNIHYFQFWEVNPADDLISSRLPVSWHKKMQ